MKRCACGCGQEVSPWSDFKKGHKGQMRAKLLAQQFGARSSSVPTEAGTHGYRGEHNRRAKLTRSQVHEILVAYANGVSASSLARQHGVSVVTIHQIVSGRLWQHG